MQEKLCWDVSSNCLALNLSKPSLKYVSQLANICLILPKLKLDQVFFRTGQNVKKKEKKEKKTKIELNYLFHGLRLDKPKSFNEFEFCV